MGCGVGASVGVAVGASVGAGVGAAVGVAVAWHDPSDPFSNPVAQLLQTILSTVGQSGFATGVPFGHLHLMVSAMQAEPSFSKPVLQVSHISSPSAAHWVPGVPFLHVQVLALQETAAVASVVVGACSPRS